MLRWLLLAVVAVLANQVHADGAVNIWLSDVGMVTPGSSFPATPSAVPDLQPVIGDSQTIYIWGRPDAGKTLANLSLNLVAETQPVCAPGCVTPDAIAFTGAMIFNETFSDPPVSRFEFVDDSTSMPPLPIEPKLVEGLEGLRIFDVGGVTAVGIGSTSDPLYDSAHNSFLIARVTYDVLATGAGTETRLYLEIGPVGLNHAGEPTASALVVFGDATDVTLNGHDNRGVHPGLFDAVIRPRTLPGDADQDGDVDPADYALWRAKFGSTTELAADHNENGVVDAADYTIWRHNLGSGVKAANALAAPESSSMLLAAIAAIALADYRHSSLASFRLRRLLSP
jgi:hypothetical protein